jgi:hypothetical protein
MSRPGALSTKVDLSVWAVPTEGESATGHLKRITAADRIMRREGEERHRIRWLRRRWRDTLQDEPEAK